VVRGGTRGVLAAGQRRGVTARDQTRCGGLDVALDSGDLTRKEQVRPLPRLPRLAQYRGPVDVGVAVHHAEANELGMLEPGINASTRACSPHFNCV
jgi:hypothetical protein